MASGVVIAGGRSTRFGDADKAFADLAGTPMLRRVADRLAPVVDRLVVNCRIEQVPRIETVLEGYPLPDRVATDDDPDEGPMAGIGTGLRAVADWVDEGELAAVVACDMPFVDPEFVAYLFERCRDHEAAVPQLDDEWFQTTQAVYRAGPMADACEAALERGDRKILPPLFSLEYVVVTDEEIRAHADERTFENVNTREELRAAQRRLE